MFKTKILLSSVKWGDWYLRSSGFNTTKRPPHFNSFHTSKVLIVYPTAPSNTKDDKYTALLHTSSCNWPLILTLW